MKKMIACLLLVSAACFSQKNFLKGYYIDNSGKKMECLIKNSDWEYNPDFFDCKTNPDDVSREVSISEAKEFAIDGYFKYVRETVAIDNSKGEPDYSIDKEPNFTTVTVFLKVLVEGTNNLYQYENNTFPIRFFFKNNTQNIQQLIYKKYFKSNENMSNLYANDFYKRQLLATVNCKDSALKVESLQYSDDDLRDYFNLVNKCSGDTSSKEVSKRQKTKLYYKLAFNTNYSYFDLISKNGIRTVPFDGSNETGKKTSFSIGVELEAILPFNNRSWAVFTEPSFISYKGDGIMTSTYYINPNYNNGYTNNDYKINFKFNSVTVPFGIKRNFNFNKNSKFYLETGINLQFVSNSDLLITRDNNGYPTFLYTELNGIKYNLLFGVGFQFKKYVIAFRQYTNTNVNPYTDSNVYAFKNTSLLLKYQFN